MIAREQYVTYEVSPHAHEQSTFTLNISVPSKFIESLYSYTLHQQKQELSTHGFVRGSIPVSYLESTYKTPIIEYLKEFFFNYCVFNELIKNIIDTKTLICGEPELRDIQFDEGKGARYCFHARAHKPECKQEWKKASFKAPQRKNYKDLDRQVESFIKEESAKEATVAPEICIGDWVCFDIHLEDHDKCELIPSYKNRMWLRMSDEELDSESYSLFSGKRKGDLFCTQSSFLHNYFSPQFDAVHNFGISIVDVSPHTYFSLDLFKRQFKIKGPKDLHQKLIEVFSHRNDISQRRETTEGVMKLVRDHYQVSIPEFLIDRQEKLVRESVKTNPDYHVYKAQSDFKKQVRQLAEKQLKDALLIDHIAKQEMITIDHDDVMCYMNLLKRPRMKEFIYFGVPLQKIGGQELPISHELVRYYTLREKTLNHIVHGLTKNR